MTRTPGRPDSGLWIDRRRFLQLGTAGAVAAARPVLAAGGVVAASETSPTAGPTARSAPSFSTVVRRRDDQLRLRFDFWNLQLQTSGRPIVVRQPGRPTPYVVVTFLPQHVMEEAYYAKSPTADDDTIAPPKPDPLTPTNGKPPPAVPVDSRLAGVSRLAFRIPDAALPIPYTVAGLLTWDAWIPSVVPAAEAVRSGVRVPGLRAPKATETAIEAPWWLILSPHRGTGWAHSARAVTHNGRTELWHTRLGGRPDGGVVDEADRVRKTVRAVWARDPGFAGYVDSVIGPDPAPPDGEDFGTSPVGMPFRTSMSPRDRYDLVVSTADHANVKSGSLYVPKPAQVEQLMLSSAGAWMDLAGSWRTGSGVSASGNSLESWRHIATGGRDQYVRIVRSGFLCGLPFGASLFKVTERTFRTVGSGTRANPKRRIAYLLQRYFIVVRQREIELGGQFHDHEGRAFPFTGVRAKTLVTPTLDPPEDDVGLGATMAFVARVGNQPFLFEMVATDRAGRTTDLAVPALFVDQTIATNVGGPMATLRSWYNGLSVTAPERVVQVRGQKVAPAEPTTDGGTDTDVELHRLTLGLEPPEPGTTKSQLVAANRPGYFPTMVEAEVRLSAAEATLGAGLGQLPIMVLEPKWVEHGFGHAQTTGELFLRKKDVGNPVNLDFAGPAKGDRAGGIITPNIPITALSRRTGTVGGNPDTFQAGTFDPTAFFGSLKANLLGDIPLGEVIAGVGSDAAEVIALRTHETADAIVTELTWTPKLQSSGPFEKNDATTLDLNATTTIPKADATAAVAVVVGELRNFTVKLLPGATFLAVHVDRLRFQSATGKKTDVDVEIGSVEFDGALRFINDLRDYLSFDSGGFSIEVQPTHVQAGFELPIPSIPLGVFSLQNITFMAGLTIPFTGKPMRFRFGFNTVDNPFLVSVMIFGGGGSFELAIGTDGVESFQASLEFGIVAALDFGVASGSVSVTAGIYLAIGVENPPTNPDGACELTGFLKIKGEVEVLGIISLGIFMKASFTYVPAIEKAVVKATIIVEIDILLFSGEVEIDYEKRFGGNDPTFGQSVLAQQWDDYTSAFAPIGA